MIAGLGIRSLMLSTIFHFTGRVCLALLTSKDITVAGIKKVIGVLFAKVIYTT